MLALVSAVLLLASLLPAVSAHGYVTMVSIDGKIYQGPKPGSSTSMDTPIRQVRDNGPVKGAANADLACGLGAPAPASALADAQPGSALSFQWQWIHNVGPVITYMAKCSDQGCKADDAKDAQWFKIHQVGMKPGSQKWYQEDIKTDSLTFKLPADLAPGEYLVRHEIIALHNAIATGGAEFYPMCLQLKVGGSGSATPADTVAFPGAYGDNDPGITAPTIFDGQFAYVFPGGALSKLANPDGGAITAPLTADSGSPADVSPLGAASGAPSPTGKGAVASGTKAAGTKGAAPTAAAPGSTAAGGSCKSGSTKSGKRFALRANPSAAAEAARPHVVSAHMRRHLAAVLHGRAKGSGRRGSA